MDLLKVTKDLFYYSRNTNLYEFAVDVWEITDLPNEPQHRLDYVTRKFESLKVFGLGDFDDVLIGRIIVATAIQYDWPDEWWSEVVIEYEKDEEE
mgnify:CR=1 FL=1|tara:strand:+ start:9133 stop:9417 length:285 start_codon:yes stop_codon:yes gene_type:complete